MAKKYDAAIEEEAVRLYDAGYTYAQISEKTGIPHGTLSGMLSRLGVTHRNDVGDVGAGVRFAIASAPAAKPEEERVTIPLNQVELSNRLRTQKCA